MGSQGSLGGIHGSLGGTDGTLGPMGPWDRVVLSIPGPARPGDRMTLRLYYEFLPSGRFDRKSYFGWRFWCHLACIYFGFSDSWDDLGLLGGVMGRVSAAVGLF